MVRLEQSLAIRYRDSKLAAVLLHAAGCGAPVRLSTKQCETAITSRRT